MDLRKHNRAAWDKRVEQGDQWTQPVSSEAIAAARQGKLEVIVIPEKPVPAAWLPPLPGLDVLCLASGGGQQGPLLAAAGARVTVLDFSPNQLAQDRWVAEREGLALVTVEGDMADLSMFASGCFDLIIHPVANTYVPDIHPVWNEAFRVLRPGGTLIAGFINPFVFIFGDYERYPDLRVQHGLPFSELTDLPPEERQQYIEQGQALQFSHTLSDQIDGQIVAGFVITGFAETRQPGHPASAYLPTHMATRALKPER